MTTKRRLGPKPLPKGDKRVPVVMTLSPNERKALAKVHGRAPFSTWARGVLLETTKDASPISNHARQKGAK